MSIKVVESFSQLKKRVQHFLSSDAYGRPEIKAALDEFSKYGSLVLFGGLLRDLSLVGNEGFNSDVDVVVKTNNWTEFKKCLQGYNYSQNKFGGFRIQLSRWSIDLWQLEDTWASKQGYVNVKTFEDLCNTTFFDWDAIAYDLETKKIIAINDYLTRVRSHIIDINLSDNPNPVGNSIKALRYLEKYEAKLSPRLASYISSVLNDYDSTDISKLEKISHERGVLGNLASMHINALEEHQKTEPLFPLKKEQYQKSLDLSHKN
ncbi:MAG: hypothetical protein V3V31_05485 [Methylococcales bacterium]